MGALLIIDFGRNHLGRVVREPGGGLRLEVIDEKYRQDLEAFLQRILDQPVSLTTGERIEKEGRATFITQRKQVGPDDEEFFSGVQQLLNKTRFGETRLRGLMLREG